MIISSHMVWGYVFGKATARFQTTKPNLALLILFISSGDWKMQLPRTKWTRLWLLLWVPPLLLTATQGFLYYEPDLLTQIYSAYAIFSSLSLLVTCATLAIRTVRCTRVRIERG